MERYSEYKDSGIEWIGDIPSDWEVRELRRTLSLVKRPPETSDEIITCFRDGEVTLRSNRRKDGFTMSDKEIGYQHISVGDLVIHGMDGFAGAIGVSDSEGKASPVLMVFAEHPGVHARYIMYLLRDYALRDVFLSLSTTIRVRSCDMNWTRIAPLKLIIPRESDQIRITRYLDKKTAEIDDLIADQETSIELLRVYRKAVISEAVTKGLDPNTPMKDSGVDWVGDIPEEWNIIPLKAVMTYGKGLAITKADLVESGVPVVSYGQIHSNANYFTDIDHSLVRFVSPVVANNNPSAEVHQGDFLFADTSEDLAGAGNFVFVKQNNQTLYAGYHVLVAHQTSVEYGRYLSYLFQCDEWRGQLRSGVNGVKLFSITQRVLSKVSALSLPLEQAVAIADHLDQKTSLIDSLITNKKQLIAKLKEYRKSLISEAVTGKFKVPGVVESTEG